MTNKGKGIEPLRKKIANAKPSAWLTKGLTKEEIKEALAEGEERIKTQYGKIRRSEDRNDDK